MLLASLMIQHESFAKIQPVTRICNNTMYTNTDYQISCDKNWTHEDPESAEKNYFVKKR